MAELLNPITGKRHRLVTRAEWGAREPRQRFALRGTSEGTFEHWAVSGPSVSVGTGGGIMRAIQNFHMDTRGWYDYAYSFGYDDGGNIFEGRGWGIAGGHTAGFNMESHAFCYLGGALVPGAGGKRYEPSSRALDALFALEAHEDVLYGRGKPNRPHRRVASTGCPGDAITSYAEGQLRRQLDGTLKPPHPAPEPFPEPDSCRFAHQGARNLKRGLVGADVGEWQFLLNVANGSDHAHWIAVDGDFGPATEAATTRFQAIYSTFFRRIDVDGIVGPDSRAALCEVLKLRGSW